MSSELSFIHTQFGDYMFVYAVSCNLFTVYFPLYRPKYALSAIRKKLFATNPNVVLMGLRVCAVVVRRCCTALF